MDTLDALELSKMPRLAVLHYALGRFGGAAKIAILQAIYLNKMGFDVELFYGGPILNDWKKRVTSEIPVNPLPLGLPKSLQDIAKITEILSKLRTFDIILVSYGICPFFAYYLTRFFERKVVWYCGEPLRALWEDFLSGLSYKSLKCTVKPTSGFLYGKSYSSIFLSEPLYNSSIRILRALDIKTIRSYRKIVANSFYTKELINRVYHLKGNVFTVHPGIDLANFRQVNKTRSIPSDYILAIGAMIPMKNYTNLLKAFSYLPLQHRSKLKLLIIGDGPLKEAIQSTIQELGLKNNVIITANINEDELFCYYKNCRFVIHVALHEPFGLVPLEAAVFGKTAIVSSIGGPKEFVVDGQSGILVNPFDPKEIARAITYFVENEKVAHRMGLKARDKVVKEFNMESSSRKLAKTLRSID